VRFDPGGIGKGLAADLVGRQIIAAGADSCLVNIGGDVRTINRPSSGEWRIDVDSITNPGAQPVASISLRQGAVATTSASRRRWRTAHGEMHHLIDPMNGQPHWRQFESLLVTADEAWMADVLAKALYLTPMDAWDGMLGGGIAVTVDADDRLQWFGTDRASASTSGVRPIHGYRSHGAEDRRTLAP
jgi:FAD:protein FMN transferase